MARTLRGFVAALCVLAVALPAQAQGYARPELLIETEALASLTRSIPQATSVRTFRER